MVSWLDLNKETIGGVLLAIGGIFGVVWGKIQSMRTEKAKTDAGVAISNSQEKTYEQMALRMTAQEARIDRLQDEVDVLRGEVRERDEEIHKLRMHIKDMEALMRLHNLPVMPLAS